MAGIIKFVKRFFFRIKSRKKKKEDASIYPMF